LNIYFVPTDPYMTAEQPKTCFSDFSSGQAAIHIPVAVKLCPFSQYGAYARRLDRVAQMG